MNNAIITKYIGPTDFKVERISARFAIGGGRIVIPFPHALSGECAHMHAAEKLIQKCNPQLRIVESAGIDSGFVFIAR